MKMMGLTDSSYWLSWFTYYAILVTIITIIITLLIGRLIKTSRTLMFVILWVYGYSLFGFSLMMQSLFTRARTAGGVATTIYFVSIFLDQVVNQPFHTYLQKTIASVVSPVALSRIFYVLTVAEGSRGLQWNNIGISYQNYKVSHGLIVMALSGVGFTLIGLYFDNVIQQSYGTAKRWYFCLQPKFWGCRCGGKRKKLIDHSQAGSVAFEAEDYYMNKTFYQPVVNPELLAQEKEDQILKIVGLKKSFGGFEAVKGVNLKMYKGQIFALLGHNGAGKTTTISMLTGLISSSEGRAQIFDKDLFNQMDDVRQFMGVCP